MPAHRAYAAAMAEDGEMTEVEAAAPREIDAKKAAPDDCDRTIHYAPADRPLCSDESVTADYTDYPAGVAGCAECLELVVEDLQDHNDYLGRCLHCRREITAQGGVEWRRAVRSPCPHCGKAGW